MPKVSSLINCSLILVTFLSSTTISGDGEESKSQIFLDRGSFMMGSNRRDLVKTGEFPQQHIQVKSFAIDKYPVTNADFRAFLKEKPNYLTDAEIEGYSWVFVKHLSFRAEVREDLIHPDGNFWLAVKNATWYQPNGLGSNIEGKDTYPIVHVSYHDGYAYCQWAGKRVVSEYEWEYAARGGAPFNKFPWGNMSDFTRANLWQGRFPDLNLGKDGYEGLSPVNAFEPQNDYGIYDMVGNVWEWTSTVFTVGRVESDPKNPLFGVRGASFLDTFDGRINDEARISNRKGYYPTYAAENLGFRCSYLWKPGQPVTKPYKARLPKHHRYEDTWDYKVKQAVKSVVGKVHRAEEL